ncbi:MFS transporter [Actinospica robiniae]|uniref:MFS transporter n=1 Tax=Actinospica robiniae TaxID=304901 RepID=UPI00040C435E|nr:MFS transporter [Actinospica robiniae]
MSTLNDLSEPVTEPASSAAPVRLDRRLRLVLVVLLAAQFMLAVDFSILNVALPALGRGLDFPLGDLQWVGTAFALAAAGFTLLFGRVADLIGRRRQFLAGLALLGISSLVGGLAVDPGMLLAARAVQGLATAAVTPAGLSLLTSAFPQGPLRDKALGLNGALMSAGFTTGAVLGGVLTDLLSWRWAFFINVPVAFAVLAVAPLVLRDSRAAERPRLDVPGAAAVTSGLLAVVFGLTTAGEHGWGDPIALGCLIGGIVLLGAFVRIERAVPRPLVPVSILTRRTVVVGNLAGLIAFATETSLVFVLTLYLQKVLGFSAMAAGLCFAVLGLGTVIGGVLAPRMLGRIGPRSTLMYAGAVQALATVLLLALGPGHGSLGLMLPATFLGGVGNMLVIVAFMVQATSDVPQQDQGMATGLATMTQQVGITMGTPIMSAVVTARTNGLTDPAAILTGVHAAVLVNAALVAAGVLIAALFARRRATRR